MSSIISAIKELNILYCSWKSIPWTAEDVKWICNHAIWLSSNTGEQTAEGLKKYYYSPQAYFLCDIGCVAHQMWYVSVFQIYHWIIDLHDFPQITQQLPATTQALQEHCCQARSQWLWNRLLAFSWN